MDRETQRNLLIAVVLSMLIMVVWTHFFAPEPPEQVERQPQRTAEQVEGTQRPEALEPEPARPEIEPLIEPPSSEELARAQDVIIETPHMSATFTTLGGRLVSLGLPEYKSKKGGRVELVADTQEMQWPLGLRFNDESFGTTTENFVYAYRSYEPGGEVGELADGLKMCSGRLSGADPKELTRELDRCLPKSAHTELREVVLAAAGGHLAADKSEAALSALATTLSKSSVLVFWRRLTPELKLIKAFVFDPQAYSFEMYVVFRNLGDRALVFGNGQASYSINWVPGMESSEKSPREDELYVVHLEGRKFGQDKARKLRGGNGFFSKVLTGIGLTQEDEQEPVELETTFSDELEWVGLKRKYFFVALEPTDGAAGAVIQPWGENPEGVRISLDMRSIKLEPGGIAADSVRVSGGPMHKTVLESLGPTFGQMLNFGFFDIFAKILLSGLLWFNEYVQNYGLAIILLTVLVRVGLFPLNQKSYRSMREMQALQPKVNELREKHKKNPQEMNRKMMELYRTHKVNPMGGCLPILFQMPVFIALFQALRYAVELRGAHFLWIVDLSEPDRLDRLFPFELPLPVNLLPLLVIVAMLVQQKMTPMAGGQSAGQQKMMQYMPIFFGFLFYSMPSGLTVYFLVSTVLGLVQQYFVQKAA